MQKKADDENYRVTDFPDTPKKLQKKHLFKVDKGVEVMIVRFDPEDTMIAAGCSDGYLKIFHLHSNNLKINVPLSGDPNSQEKNPCTALRWRPPQYSSKTKNVLVSACADGSIVHWHVTTGKEISRVKEQDNQIFGLDYTKDGTQFATVGKDTAIRIYDEEQKLVMQTLSGVGWKDVGHSNRVFACKFVPEDQNLLITGGWDQNILIWDVREGKSVRTIVGPKIGGDAIDFKNGQILTGANRAKGQLELWDFGTGNLIRQIDWEPGTKTENGAFVYACQFSKTSEESVLAGASGLNMARIFDQQRDYKPFGSIESLDKGIYTVDYGNFSNKFAAAGGNGIVWVYALSTQ